MLLSGCTRGRSPGSLGNPSREGKVVKQMHLLGQILATEVNGRNLFDFPFAVSGFHQEETELCVSGLKWKKTNQELFSIVALNWKQGDYFEQSN